MVSVDLLEKDDKVENKSVFWSMMHESRVYKGVLLMNDLTRCSARAGSV